MGRFQAHRKDFLLRSENGPISDFKNPGFRSHKTWSSCAFCIILVSYGNITSGYSMLRDNEVRGRTPPPSFAPTVFVLLCFVLLCFPLLFANYKNSVWRPRRNLSP